MELTDTTYQALCQVIHNLTGIHLSSDKMPLLESRLGKLIVKLGLTDYESYLDYLAQPDNRSSVRDLVNSISTNVTSFFREQDHFPILEQHFLEKIAQGQHRYRYWSAACSSGEEPYTLAMVLDHFHGTGL